MIPKLLMSTAVLALSLGLFSTTASADFQLRKAGNISNAQTKSVAAKPFKLSPATVPGEDPGIHPSDPSVQHLGRPPNSLEGLAHEIPEARGAFSKARLLFDPAFVEKPQIYQCPKTELKYKITEGLGSWIGEERKIRFDHVEVQDAYSGKKWLICVYGVGAGKYHLRRMVPANHKKCEQDPTHSNRFLCTVMKPK